MRTSQVITRRFHFQWVVVDRYLVDFLRKKDYRIGQVQKIIKSSKLDLDLITVFSRISWWILLFLIESNQSRIGGRRHFWEYKRNGVKMKTPWMMITRSPFPISSRPLLRKKDYTKIALDNRWMQHHRTQDEVIKLPPLGSCCSGCNADFDEDQSANHEIERTWSWWSPCFLPYHDKINSRFANWISSLSTRVGWANMEVSLIENQGSDQSFWN